MENNTSGQGKYSEIPAEIQGWSWGAFLLSWVWGIGNNTYRAFWVFFPLINFFMMIFLGLKGNEWAWRHRKWESVEHFKEVQSKWTRASLTLIAVGIAFGIIMVFFIGSILKDSEPYKMSIAIVSESDSFMTQVGQPFETGFVTGGIQTSGPQGEANLLYDVEGPNGEAEVAVKAKMNMGAWSIECLSVDYLQLSSREELIPCNVETY